MEGEKRRMLMKQIVLLTVEEFAKLTSLSPWTVRRMCRDGLLRARKIGRGWRISSAELESF